jgi:DNA repair protein RadC
MGRASGENLHDGHRARLRRRFLDEGLDGFEDHQVLELLLFYGIPRRDTNEIAHLLLRRHGSLAGVLDAEVADLQANKGIGEGAALLLSLVPAVARRYLHDRCRRSAGLRTTEQVAEFIVPLMVGRSEELFYVVCVDTQLRPIVPAVVATGSVNKAHIEPRHVVEAALRHKAHAVVLAHNHPTGNARPTTADHRLTKTLVDALGLIGIRVLDHLVVAEDDWYSFARAGDLPAAPRIDKGGA